MVTKCFSAWIAWFPLLFYTTLYIGDLYKRTTPLSSNPDVQELHDRDAEATRLGTRALFFSAIVSLFLNLVLPACVVTPARRSHYRDRSVKIKWWRRIGLPEPLKVDLASLWAISNLVLAMSMFGTLYVQPPLICPLSNVYCFPGLSIPLGARLSSSVLQGSLGPSPSGPLSRWYGAFAVSPEYRFIFYFSS